jgi:hypothetical protein
MGGCVCCNDITPGCRRDEASAIALALNCTTATPRVDAIGQRMEARGMGKKQGMCCVMMHRRLSMDVELLIIRATLLLR